MRLLIFQAQHFTYLPTHKGSPLGEDIAVPRQQRLDNLLAAFIQLEPRDEERDHAVLTQAVKYFRWYARKRGCRHILLHSFAHLGEQRSSPEFALNFFQRLEEQLKQHDFQVAQTPFGWSLEWEMKVDGHAFAKTFKEL